MQAFSLVHSSTTMEVLSATIKKDSYIVVQRMLSQCQIRSYAILQILRTLLVGLYYYAEFTGPGTKHGVTASLPRYMIESAPYSQHSHGFNRSVVEGPIFSSSNTPSDEIVKVGVAASRLALAACSCADRAAWRVRLYSR